MGMALRLLRGCVDMGRKKSSLSMKQGDLIMGILLLAFSIIFYYLTYHFAGYEIEKIPHDVGPAFMPRFLLGALTVEAIVLVLLSVARKSEAGGEPVKIKPIFQLRPMTMLASFLLYIYLTTLFGYIPATIAFMLLAFFLLGIRSIRIMILIPPLITLATYFLFGTLLNIYLPSGSLF